MLFKSTSKIILVLLVFYFGASLFASSALEFSLNYETSITPFSLIPVFFESVPEDVYAAKVELILIPEGSLQTTCHMNHTAFYPVLTNNNNDRFIMLHFFWMFQNDANGDVISDTPYGEREFLRSLPQKVHVKIEFDMPLKPYAELLKTKITHKGKEIETFWNAKSVEQIVPILNKPQHKKAVILVHGLQSSIYKELVANTTGITGEWKSEGLRHYWDGYYQFEDVDYFEYHYDSILESMTYYGSQLSTILEKSNIIHQYDEINIISYSLGGMVTQYAINTPLENGILLLGDTISTLFHINGILEGTYFLNLTDYLLTHVQKTENLNFVETFYDEHNGAFLFETLDLLTDYNALLLKTEKLNDFLDEFVEFYKQNPLLACVLLTSFDDVPFVGGQIVPFKGMKSMRYTSREFLSSLEKSFYFPENTYTANEALRLLNEKNKFLDKTIIISSHVANAEEFLDRSSKFLQNLSFLFKTETANQQVNLLSIPFVQSLVQRVISVLIKSFAEEISMKEHYQNDGFVTCWSQMMMPYQNIFEEDQLYDFSNIDHAQIKNSPLTLEVLRKRINK